MRQPPSGAQTLERAVALLKVFEHEGTELRVSEIVAATGLGQSTVSRLLATLEGADFVEHDPRSGLYRLGPGVVGLAGIALNQNPIHRESRQIAQALACELGLGANVGELHGSQVRYLCHFEGTLAPRNFTLIGRTAPLHATGLGKAILAQLDPDEMAGLVASDTLSRFTPHTLTDAAHLQQELATIRRQGYATEVEELALGRACVAAAILDRRSRPVAALSVSGPLSALALDDREAKLGLRVIEAADTISVALGYMASSGWTAAE